MNELLIIYNCITPDYYIIMNCIKAIQSLRKRLSL